MVGTLIVGNWKMNGLRSALDEAIQVASQLVDLSDDVDCLLCPPATLIAAMVQVAGDRLKVGGQTCHAAQAGAHTGDISAEMLADAGASHVIIGHSERRTNHAENDTDVAAQALAALRAKLIPIICIGETRDQREAGEAMTVIERQLVGSLPDALSGKAFVVAYEPVWAVGTGNVASVEQIAAIHGRIRTILTKRFGDTGSNVPILYGGSMTPVNAAEILAIQDVNGGLIGGASLKAVDFMSIYQAALR